MIQQTEHTVNQSATTFLACFWAISLTGCLPEHKNQTGWEMQKRMDSNEEVYKRNREMQRRGREEGAGPDDLFNKGIPASTPSGSATHDPGLLDSGGNWLQPAPYGGNQRTLQ